MIPIIIAAHGRLAEELINSAEMIFGKQENVETILFAPGENTENLKKKYREKMEKFRDSKEILIIVDLFGGSPYNAAFEIAIINKNIDILTGASLPMVLEILSIRDNEDIKIKDIISSINDSSNSYIRSCKQLQEAISEEEL
ncbi:PTS system, mannose/fructose/sorbose family, IIA component [Clostridium pasteurianum DSM 525 = ATCC 6013]|uniref:PTS system, mannose/fructose/sorbose family, IIA component n=1 Tax=Clostridium pasteurianum DSM 525 = ATCC 6013 TaxID=1262449 RepID=A0A0H3J4X2_CLOPA|nr:mannose/fructose/sorbose PTS transporter subunit IIA [Clostridium pasteurianum]AJA48966.1 PTS system, mannose/fructose/sorbose family, IIA component [Clostridium pasteurianum DSM 525 = ATCC 6013]AJA52954.1 PTS system, mannose/fructose/sorbose family, IIA component [Clostridium pasteurianum DSM 525 = ATCC 6013]AOZ76173.1 PTS mannose transporter subunit IID [Clostridium pasteurianum DSM 525 = ATCC 6013]AOZ79969.1 PTS mannose transporter subunit IID [Clostridium pasteurianum]ELP60262.1 hypothe